MAIFIHENDLPSNIVLSGDLAIDTETMGLNHHRDRLCVLQISDGRGDAHLIKFTKDSYQQAQNLKELLSDSNRCKIFHFARFDIAAIEYNLNIQLDNIYCTKIASKLARTYTDSHGLKELCRDMLGVQISKQQQSSDWGDSSLSKEQAEYAANDVLHLHALRNKLNKILVREGRMEIAQKCFDFVAYRARLDLAGWPESDIFAH
jgi:ribonuclease D